MTAQTTPINGHDEGKTELAIGVESRRVVLRFPQPMLYVVLEAENARLIANALGRAAYEAHYGMAAPEDMSSVIAQELRERITAHLRERMINRVVLMLASMDRDHRRPAHKAAHLVDAMLREIT